MPNINLLKEIMDNNLLASGELPQLRAEEVELGGELDVTAVSVERLDLPCISWDILEDYFAKGAFNGGEPGDESKRMNNCFGDGEFDVEE